MDETERVTMAKVMWRLLPLLMVCYFIAYLDRVNVSFAKLQMDQALGMDDAMFGFGAGIFFWAYFLLEVPSNLALAHFGARRWIARIMITWGIVSGAFAFIPQIAPAVGLSQATTFYILRFALGIAEAGFFPGIIFYLTQWFPALYRARVIGLFMVAIQLANIIGSPISGSLLNLSGWGLDGWQWLFIIEAVPSLVLAAVVLTMMCDRPALAPWLHPDESAWLETRIAEERRKAEHAEHFGILKAMTDVRVLMLALVYFCLNAASYGIGFFIPTIVKAFGVTNVQTGLISALPFLCGAVGMILFSRHSDKTMERKGHVAVALLMATVGVGGSALIADPVTKMIFLCFGQIGIAAVPPLFWPLPASFLTGASAAAGIAAINSLGNLSGYFGPDVMGALKKATGDFTAGSLVLAGCTLVGAVVVMLLRINPALERAAGDAAPAE